MKFTLFDNVIPMSSVYHSHKGVKMQENLLNKKNNNNIKAAEKYVGKYLRDLQNHFNLNDMQLIKIMQKCIDNIKKKNKQNKWWQFF